MQLGFSSQNAPVMKTLQRMLGKAQEHVIIHLGRNDVDANLRSGMDGRRAVGCGIRVVRLNSCGRLTQLIAIPSQVEKAAGAACTGSPDERPTNIDGQRRYGPLASPVPAQWVGEPISKAPIVSSSTRLLDSRISPRSLHRSETGSVR